MPTESPITLMPEMSPVPPVDSASMKPWPPPMQWEVMSPKTPAMRKGKRYLPLPPQNLTLVKAFFVANIA